MKRVLIVDDEYIVVEGIKTMINREKMDFEVVGYAYDGIEGARLILETKPDLVITDIRMPGMDGLSLIQEVQEHTPDTIFVVISGYQEFEYARKALSLGVKGYIDKPITIDKVRNTMDMASKLIEAARMQKHEAALEQNKKNYQELSSRLIRIISSKKTAEYNETIAEAVRELKAYTGTLEEYKEESYKLVCLALGVFYEARGENKEVQHFPSHSNLEHMNSVEEVDMFIHELFHSMFVKLQVAEMGGMHRTIEKLLEYINQNYHKDIGLSELASMVDMNPAYLSILFKEEVGLSYIKYLTKVRMEMAKKLLMEGCRVAEVSERVGYSNYRYFCDIFKKQEGQTPSEFKGTVRKK